MKIVYYSYSYWPPDFGGDLLITIERFQSLVKAGHEVTVLTSGRKGFADRVYEDGILILRSPVIGEVRPARLLRRMVFWIWCFLHLCTISADVIHEGDVGGVDAWSSALVNGMCSWVAKLRMKGSLWVLSLAETDYEPFECQATKKTLKNIRFGLVKKIVSVSPALHHSVAKCFPRKAVYIPYGVRDDLFHPLDAEERLAFRMQKGASNQDIIFTFLGSLGQRKGFDLLADSFAELAQKHSDWKLWVVGPRSRIENVNVDEIEVAHVIEPLAHVQDQVVFWGRVNDRRELANILASSDVFIFPTRREGMPISPMEAMSCGLPVIISRIPGVTDVVNIENETGLYVPPGDLHALKSAMQTLGDDSGLRQRMGIAARERIANKFGWEQHIKQWLQIYQQLSK